LLTLPAAGLLAQPAHYPPAEQVARDFRARVQRPADDLTATTRLITTDSVLILRGTMRVEKNEVIPFVIYKPVDAGNKKLPVVICLHGTGGNKDEGAIKDILYRLTKMGFMGVAIDARYHGERVPGGGHSSAAYVAAVTRAWENKDTAHQDHPFFFDTVSDLWWFTGYIASRPDVDSARMGMMGVSMGGIETWMAASVDKRIKVTVPIIAAQSFKWSLDNDRWQGRAHTIWGAHQQAAADMGDTAVNKKNVQALWDKLLPGITGEFDCPSMLRLFAPRPLLLLSNEKDQNCPLPGAKIAYAAAREAYEAKGAAGKLEMIVAPNEPHRLLPDEVKMMLAFFGKWL
jgi:dienelactone hydrolase